MLAAEIDRRQGLEGRDVAAAGHDDVGDPRRRCDAHSQIPSPRVQCRTASSIDEVVERRLLAGHDDVDVVRLRRQWSATDSRQLVSGGR